MSLGTINCIYIGNSENYKRYILVLGIYYKSFVDLRAACEGVLHYCGEPFAKATDIYRGALLNFARLVARTFSKYFENPNDRPLGCVCVFFFYSLVSCIMGRRIVSLDILEKRVLFGCSCVGKIFANG